MATISKIKLPNNASYDIRDDYSVWGGRNLLPLSQLQTYGGGTLTTTSEYTVDKGIITASGQASNSHLPGWKIYVEPGYDYIVSGRIITAQTTEPVRAYTRAYNSSNTQLYNQISVTDDVSSPAGSYFSFLLLASQIPTNTSYINIGIGLLNGVNYSIQLKLEKGNKPTDWSPAPEDIAKFIGNETIELYSE